MTYQRNKTSVNSGAPLEGERLVIRRTYRIGVQQLSYVLVPIEPGSKFVTRQYYVTIKNRTYYAKHPISASQARIWKALLTKSNGSAAQENKILRSTR